MRTRQVASPTVVVAVGMVGLASAMGIGRFAFTPLMPLMQAHSGLTLTEGGWLAAANYAGYLVGALLCVFADPKPGVAARAGLAGVAFFTLAMGVTADFPWWLLWRFVAGVASALVLVGISAWALQRLGRAERAHWAGWRIRRRRGRYRICRSRGPRHWRTRNGAERGMVAAQARRQRYTRIDLVTLPAIGSRVHDQRCNAHGALHCR